jgi:hypothetical protein
MTSTARLERAYRRWLRCYPPSFRREHEDELLGVLLADARDGQRRPAASDCFDLLRGAVCLHLRPRLPRSDRWSLTALRLMYIGALAELATVLTVRATFGQIRASILARHPGYTQAQWEAELAGSLKPLVVAGSIAVVVSLVIAWAYGRRQRWAKIVFAALFALNLYSLVNGLRHGSATYARLDLAAAVALCATQLAGVVLAFHDDFRRIGSPRRRRA